MHALVRGARVHARSALAGPHLSSLPERELVLAYVVHDDERAFAELYRRLRPYLFAVARRRVACPDIAQDLVQQAFLNAHAARHRFQLQGEFRPWITRIIVNLALDHRRSLRKRTIASIDPAELSAPIAPDPSERACEVACARRALAALGPRQREVVEMHCLEDRSFPEVARALGERLSAVKVRAHRAYRELRQTLGTSR